MAIEATFKSSSGAVDDSVVLMGDTYRVLIDEKGSRGVIGVIECLIQPGGGPPPHLNRREDLTWYVLENHLTFSLGEHSQRVSAGESLFIPKETSDYHTFRNDGALPARALLVVSPGGFEGFIREAGVPAGEPAPEITPEGVQQMVRLGRQYGMDMRVD
jgi:quercetin dioxygenase-like cupin family protein